MKLRAINAALVCLVFVTSLSPLLQLTEAVQATITNIKCISLNNSCIEINECRLRAVKRNLNEISVHAKFLQPPVVTAMVQMKFMKKSNGYRPFMGELHFDLCKLLDAQGNPLLKYLYSFLQPYTNINHSCPIDHDFILKNFRIDQGPLNRVKVVPSGDYAFFGTWTLNSAKCVRSEIYFTYKE